MADGRVGRVRVAHVGCGAWGANLVRELAAHPRVALDLVIDPDAVARQRARALAPGVTTAASVGALAEHRPDAVVIASPGPLHAEHAMAALSLGAHVFLEKPMTTSVADARALVAERRAAQRVGMVGHLLHHHAAVRAMLRAVCEGRIGTPRAFRSARLCKHGSRDADGSLLWSLAPHDMSVLRALEAGPVRHMAVQLRATDGAGVANHADIQVRLAGGLEAHVVVSRAHRAKVRCMEVAGDEATVVFDDLAEPKLTLCPAARGRKHGTAEAIGFDTAVSPLTAEVDAFVCCVCEGTRPQIGFTEGLEVVELIERAHAVASWTSESPSLLAAR